jgi:hypothetical protein
MAQQYRAKRPTYAIKRPSAFARRQRDILIALTADQGGQAHLSTTRQELVRRFAAGAALAEQMENDLIRGAQLDVGQYVSVCNSLQRTASLIGLGRTIQSAVPTLRQIMEEEEPNG